MKKLLLTLLTVVMSVSAWSQDPEPEPNWSVTSFSGSISNNSTTINEATWTLSDMTVGSNTNGAPAWSISASKWKFGNSSKQYWSSYTLSTTKFNSYNITKVEIGCYDNGNTESSVTVKQGEITIGTATVSQTNTPKTCTLNTNTGAGGVLKIIYSSTKQASYITSIKVWYTLPDDAVNVESVSLDQSALNLMVGKKATLTATISPINATNQEVSWSSNDTEVATVDNGVVKGLKEGTATITVTTQDGSLTDQCVVTVTPKTAPVGATFYESFDSFNGEGGNDDKWSGTLSMDNWGTNSCDNSGWTKEGTVMEASACAGIRKDTNPSGLTTPVLGTAGNGKVQFLAEAWGTDTSDFYVEILNGGTFLTGQSDIVSLTNNGTTAKVALQKNGEFKEYNLNFTGLTANSKFRFYMAAGKRGFLDEVAVFITEKAYDLTIGTSGWASMYLDFNAKVPAGTTAYYASTVDQPQDPEEDMGIITLTSVDAGQVLPAGTGVLVNGTSCRFTESDETPATVTGNLFEGVTEATECMANANWVLNTAETSMSCPVLSLYTGTTLGANKAYLPVSNSLGAKTLKLVFSESTGIQSVQQNAQNGVVYNLAGQRVVANAKGIVIINGKKYLNK